MGKKVMVVVGVAGLALSAQSWVARANAQALPSADVATLQSKARAGGTVRLIARLPGADGIHTSSSVMANAEIAVESTLRLGARSARRLAQRPLVALEVDASTLDKVLSSGMFVSVREALQAAPHLDRSVPQIGADVVQQAGSIGTGWDVAVLDTGVDNDHPSLMVVSEACYSSTGTSLCPGGAASSTAQDSADACVGAASGIGDCVHGTHVAGIATARACGQAGCSPWNGVAPGAGVIAINVFHRTGTAATGFDLRADEADIIDALDRVRALSATRNIASVNLSLGGGLYSGDCDNVSPDFKSAVDDLAAVGITVTVSSGNDGNTSQISWPSCHSNVVSVGNVDNSDTVWPTSNVSTSMDVWAPGGGNTSTGDRIDSTFPINWTASGLGDMSGTSMAAPHVAGTIALLKAYNPALTSVQLRTLLEDTGVAVTDARAGGSITAPRIDALAAAEDVTRDLVSPETDAAMGKALAAGDFNGDGFGDLAVGVPNRNVGSASNAGVVEIYYGSASGPSVMQLWSQGSSGVQGWPEANDHFGGALATGDFDGDGLDDLAIGAPGENLEGSTTVTNAGAVYILYGGEAGMTGVGAMGFSQDTGSVEGAAEESDAFGSSLAAGDFNNDGRDDLAIGVPGENVGTLSNAGAVQVIYGSSDGLSATAIPDQLWTQDSPSIDGGCEAGDKFGAAVAAGDLNGDGRADLAVGAPGEQVASAAGAGAVNVIYGSGAGLSATSVADQMWHQDSTSVLDTAEAGDAFGSAVAIGDFNNNNLADLAIGVPNEDVGALADAGAVTVLYSSGAAGLSATSNQLWHQDTASVEGACMPSDKFGARVATGDLNDDGRADLVVGVTGEDGSAGVVNVIYGASTGLSATATADQVWSQDSTDIAGGLEAGDLFGSALAVADFNGNGRADLAIGVPAEKIGAVVGAGAVNVIYGVSASGLGSAMNEAITE